MTRRREPGVVFRAMVFSVALAAGGFGTVREFSLTPQETRWELKPGVTTKAMAYNGQIPGPEIRVREGDTVRVRVHNKLKEPTTVHWHGLEVPYRMDGFPGITQKPILPDSDFAYEFAAKPAGNRFYHSHFDEPRQMTAGLHGAFIIEPARPAAKPDRHYVIFVTEWNVDPTRAESMPMPMPTLVNINYFTMNGKVFPATSDLPVRKGERVRITLIHMGAAFHPFHLHGHQFRIAALDGNEIPRAQQVARNVVPLLPGESVDIEFEATNPGVWALHCHEPHHMLNNYASSPGGLLALVVYQGFEKEADAARHLASAPMTMPVGGTR